MSATITNGLADQLRAPVTLPPGYTPQVRGRAVAKKLMAATAYAQQNAPRSLQSEQRVLGMSELGGCREYIRASLAGDPKTDLEKIKWPAYVGTALGDKLENDLVGLPDELIRASNQGTVQVKLRRTGITVQGHYDLVVMDVLGDGVDDVIDFKSKDGTTDIRSTGPKFKELVQVSGYLIALVQQGVLEATAYGHLMYVDRSGREPEWFSYSVSYQEAVAYLDAAEDRIIEIAHAIDSGITQEFLRDEPESWCFNVGCPFYAGCWSGAEYNPTDPIEHPELLRAMDLYAEGRDLGVLAEEKKRTAKSILNPESAVADPETGDAPGRVRGRSEKWILNWTDKPYGDRIVPTISLRATPPKKTEEPR